MSGGKFGYFHNKISLHAEELFDTIDDVKSPEVKAKIKEAVNMARKLAIYSRRIDWLMSGDDGEKTFLKRLKDDLADEATREVK